MGASLSLKNDQQQLTAARNIKFLNAESMRFTSAQLKNIRKLKTMRGLKAIQSIGSHTHVQIASILTDRKQRGEIDSQSENEIDHELIERPVKRKNEEIEKKGNKVTMHELTGLQLDEIKVMRTDVFDNLESTERLASTRVSQLQIQALANIYKTDRHNEITINDNGFICVTCPNKAPTVFRNLQLKRLPVEQRIAFQRLMGTQAHLKSHRDGQVCKDAGQHAHGGYSIDDDPSIDSHCNDTSKFEQEDSMLDESVPQIRVLDEDKETKSNDLAQSMDQLDSLREKEITNQIGINILSDSQSAEPFSAILSPHSLNVIDLNLPDNVTVACEASQQVMQQHQHQAIDQPNLVYHQIPEYPQGLHLRTEEESKEINQDLTIFSGALGRADTQQEEQEESKQNSVEQNTQSEQTAGRRQRQPNRQYNQSSTGALVSAMRAGTPSSIQYTRVNLPMAEVRGGTGETGIKSSIQEVAYTDREVDLLQIPENLALLLDTEIQSPHNRSLQDNQQVEEQDPLLRPSFQSGSGGPSQDPSTQVQNVTMNVIERIITPTPEATIVIPSDQAEVYQRIMVASNRSSQQETLRVTNYPIIRSHHSHNRQDPSQTFQANEHVQISLSEEKEAEATKGATRSFADVRPPSLNIQKKESQEIQLGEQTQQAHVKKMQTQVEMLQSSHNKASQSATSSGHFQSTIAQVKEYFEGDKSKSLPMDKKKTFMVSGGSLETPDFRLDAEKNTLSSQAYQMTPTRQVQGPFAVSPQQKLNLEQTKNDKTVELQFNIDSATPSQIAPQLSPNFHQNFSTDKKLDEKEETDAVGDQHEVRFKISHHRSESGVSYDFVASNNLKNLLRDHFHKNTVRNKKQEMKDGLKEYWDQMSRQNTMFKSAKFLDFRNVPKLHEPNLGRGNKKQKKKILQRRQTTDAFNQTLPQEKQSAKTLKEKASLENQENFSDQDLKDLVVANKDDLDDLDSVNDSVEQQENDNQKSQISSSSSSEPCPCNRRIEKRITISNFQDSAPRVLINLDNEEILEIHRSSEEESPKKAEEAASFAQQRLPASFNDSMRFQVMESPNSHTVSSIRIQKTNELEDNLKISEPQKSVPIQLKTAQSNIESDSKSKTNKKRRLRKHSVRRIMSHNNMSDGNMSKVDQDGQSQLYKSKPLVEGGRAMNRRNSKKQEQVAMFLPGIDEKKQIVRNVSRIQKLFKFVNDPTKLILSTIEPTLQSKQKMREKIDFHFSNNVIMEDYKEHEQSSVCHSIKQRSNQTSDVKNWGKIQTNRFVATNSAIIPRSAAVRQENASVDHGFQRQKTEELKNAAKRPLTQMVSPQRLKTIHKQGAQNQNFVLSPIGQKTLLLDLDSTSEAPLSKSSYDSKKRAGVPNGSKLDSTGSFRLPTRTNQQLENFYLDTSIEQRHEKTEEVKCEKPKQLQQNSQDSCSANSQDGGRANDVLYKLAVTVDSKKLLNFPPSLATSPVTSSQVLASPHNSGGSDYIRKVKIIDQKAQQQYLQVNPDKTLKSSDRKTNQKYIFSHGFSSRIFQNCQNKNLVHSVKKIKADLNVKDGSIIPKFFEEVKKQEIRHNIMSNRFTHLSPQANKIIISSENMYLPAHKIQPSTTTDKASKNDFIDRMVEEYQEKVQIKDQTNVNKKIQSYQGTMSPINNNFGFFNAKKNRRRNKQVLDSRSIHTDNQNGFYDLAKNRTQMMQVNHTSETLSLTPILGYASGQVTSSTPITKALAKPVPSQPVGVPKSSPSGDFAQTSNDIRENGESFESEDSIENSSYGDEYYDEEDEEFMDHPSKFSKREIVRQSSNSMYMDESFNGLQNLRGEVYENVSTNPHDSLELFNLQSDGYSMTPSKNNLRADQAKLMKGFNKTQVLLSNSRSGSSRRDKISSNEQSGRHKATSSSKQNKDDITPKSAKDNLLLQNPSYSQLNMVDSRNNSFIETPMSRTNQNMMQISKDNTSLDQNSDENFTNVLKIARRNQQQIVGVSNPQKSPITAKNSSKPMIIKQAVEPISLHKQKTSLVQPSQSSDTQSHVRRSSTHVQKDQLLVKNNMDYLKSPISKRRLSRRDSQNSDLQEDAKDDESPSGDSRHSFLSQYTIKTSSCVRKKKQGKKQINQYIMMRQLGQGKFAKVKLIYDEMTKEKFAMKIINKQKLRRQSIQGFGPPNAKRTQEVATLLEKEGAIMKKMGHPHIVKLFEIIDDPDHHKQFLIQEYVQGGDLEQKIYKTGLTETQVRKYFRQLISAVWYCHEVANVYHRDIKPENILIDSGDNIKLSDFGVGEIQEKSQGSKSKKTAGSYPYMCPESFQMKDYSDKQADLWACSISLYEMIYKQRPFVGKNTQETVQSIQNETPKYSKSMMKFDCRDKDTLIDLMQRLLNKDPQKRLTIDEMQHHPWITDGGRYPCDWQRDVDYVEFKGLTEDEINSAKTKIFKQKHIIFQKKN